MMLRTIFFLLLYFPEVSTERRKALLVLLGNTNSTERSYQGSSFRANPLSPWLQTFVAGMVF